MTEALRLFLIEDDDDIALLIRKSLERAGHQVTRCRTAADALIVLGQTVSTSSCSTQACPTWTASTCCSCWPARASPSRS